MQGPDNESLPGTTRLVRTKYDHHRTSMASVNRQILQASSTSFCVGPDSNLFKGVSLQSIWKKEPNVILRQIRSRKFNRKSIETKEAVNNKVASLLNH